MTRIVVDSDLAGGVAVVRDGADLTRSAAGFADVETRTGFAPNTHIRAASMTKTFVAATIMQLVAEGRIDLDAPIETYLPGRIRGKGIDANAITVRQLMRHQSGLPEYFDAETPPPDYPTTGEQLLDTALTRPAQFAPGATMKYTNTNYIVLGLLIGKVTGRPAADEITWRIIVPLGLFDTYFPAPGDNGLRPVFADGYELVNGRRTDVTDFNASAASTAGAPLCPGCSINPHDERCARASRYRPLLRSQARTWPSANPDSRSHRRMPAWALTAVPVLASSTHSITSSRPEARNTRAASASTATGRSARARIRSIVTVSKDSPANGNAYISPRRNSQWASARPCRRARARRKAGADRSTPTAWLA